MNTFDQNLLPPANANELGLCVFVMPGRRQVTVESLWPGGNDLLWSHALASDSNYEG